MSGVSELSGSSSSSSRGHPVQIVRVDEDEHSFSLDEDALNDILQDERVKDKPICVVSVAGAFRRGKSFLLDFFLRYLQHLEDNGDTSGPGDWLGDKESPLQGFHWRGGMERDTTGIVMWSKVFLVKTPRGKEVAVVLFDTQGAFDRSSTVQDCATVFALSTMLSSVLVYNLSANIQEDNLQHLGMFIEYGRLALEDSGEKPFQRLQFLVRDWSYPYEAPFGADGGNKVVNTWLEVTDNQHQDLQDLRKHIRSCFASIDGFLLPHPGLRVATDPNFDGKLKDIEPMFLENLESFIPRLLSPGSVVPKRISGNEVRCKELVQFFRAYMEIFKGDEMPEPKSMLKATSEANNLAALTEAKDAYVSMMEAVCGGEKPYINEHVLEVEHLRIKDHAMEIFSNRRKMGGEEFSASYRERLEKEVEESYVNYRAHNDGKNLFKAANTPITLGAISMLLYVASQFLSLLGLTPFAQLVNLVLTLTITLLSTWGYVRYTGRATEIGEQIDAAASTAWENGLQPVFSKLAEEGTQFAARKAVERLNSTSSLNSPGTAKKNA